MNANGMPPEDDGEDFEMNTRLTDELYEEMEDNVIGEKVVGLALWEESLADDEENRPEADERQVFDLDLYLENNLYFELYGVLFFTDQDGDPLQGLDRIGTIVAELTDKGVWLDDIAATEEDEMVLILSQNHEPKLYLSVGGWTLNEWETLPDEE
ncbi:MAG: hypothetical protein KJZ86_18775 [Caldilineaceae bacterium]|nr:hypothetical protein [Caldilineaceae bacterium]HRJ40680.1 hypothetical protein [Caldilineaceae bacterium]